MKTKTTDEIILRIIEDGLVENNTELENEFVFAATEAGCSDEEIRDAMASPWFPWFVD